MLREFGPATLHIRNRSVVLRHIWIIFLTYVYQKMVQILSRMQCLPARVWLCRTKNDADARVGRRTRSASASCPKPFGILQHPKSHRLAPWNRPLPQHCFPIHPEKGVSPPQQCGHNAHIRAPNATANTLRINTQKAVASHNGSRARINRRRP